MPPAEPLRAQTTQAGRCSKGGDGIGDVRPPAPSDSERDGLLASLQDRIKELNEEADMFGDPPPSQDAVQHMTALAVSFLPWVVAKRLPLPTVFLRDGGSLELVVTNPPISRRLTAHLSKDGRQYVVYLTDGRGPAREPAQGSADRPVDTGWMEWLCPPT